MFVALKRHRLLVVDDESAARDGYERSLAAHFDVGVVNGAAEAVEHLRAEQFDLVITDEAVADIDGISLLVRLRDLNINVPVILLTAAWDNMTMLRARAHGAMCLTKPIDEATLATAVHQRIDAVTSAGRVAAAAPAAPTAALSTDSIETVTATFAKNEFRRVLETAAKNGRVVITKYQDPRAVLMSFDEYQRLLGAREPKLDMLTREFDGLLAKMQAPKARAGATAAFSMSSDELGAAAVAAAKKRD